MRCQILSPGALLKVPPEMSGAVRVAFVGNEVQFCSDSALVAEAASFVFRHHLCPPVDDPRQTVDVVADGDGFRFVAEGQVVAIAMNLADLPVTLMQVGQQRLIFKETSHAMLHAAVLVRNGCGLLLPAVAGSGKTTLTAWLLGDDFGLLSDELAAVGPGDVLDGLTRPLNIKPGSRLLVDGFDWLGDALAQSRLSADVTLVPWQRHRADKLRAAAIICPCYEANAAFSVERLSHGLCAKALMGSLLNARNLPKHGLAFANHFAGARPGYRIRYSNLADVSVWLAQQEFANSGLP